MSITSEEEENPPTISSRSSSTYSTSASSSDDSDSPLQPPNPPFSHTFAPPFYGRPPTPLPPSPSLTSLLRPSRPTTPDASDDESGLHHDPVPRAAPKVPTYEYYGFVLYLFSTLSFAIYLLWSYLPSPFLHGLGIYYYPNRWWSLAVPSFLVMLLCYIYIALAAYNLERLTLPLSDLGTVVDEAGVVATVDSKGRIRGGLEGRRREKEKRDRGKKDGRKGHRRDKSERDGGYRDRDRIGASGQLNWREVWNEGTDAVMDVPLAGVCEVLYGEGREDGDGNGYAY
ncbi:PIG-P-domain-containing protein [Coniochaeta sp. PMI_546]|nr:PIG-P-domain-containing protein [Coniochaeta sp. PMI_546]